MSRSAGEHASSKVRHSEDIPKSISLSGKRHMARVNLSVDESVFEEFSAQAKRQNKTLFALANEALSAASKVSAEGSSPSDFYRLWRTFSLLRQVEAITLPSDFVDELIAKLYAADKEDLLRMFRNLGANLIGLLKIAAKDVEGLSNLMNDFAALLPVKLFKVVMTENDTMEVDVVGAGRRIESTECTSELLTSILNGYGYTVTKRDLGVGTIRFLASKRKGSPFA